MSKLKQVTTGPIKKPHFLTVYGVEGVGKSTLGAGAPNPIFLGLEEGTDQMNVSRYSTKDYGEVNEFINELIETDHSYKTLVVDTLDHLEPMLQEWVCKQHGKKHIEDFGYGKGFGFAQTEWGHFLDRCKQLRSIKGMNILLLAHSHVKPFNDPNGEAYDRYRMKLNEKAGALIREVSDCVLFANFEVFTKENDKGKIQAFGDGSRKLYTQWRPSWDAKNRFNLPLEIDLDWDELNKGVEANMNVNPVELYEEILGLSTQITAPDIKKQVLTYTEDNKTNPAALMGVREKVKTMIQAH